MVQSKGRWMFQESVQGSCRWEWTKEQEKFVAKRETVGFPKVCKPLENCFLVVLLSLHPTPDCGLLSTGESQRQIDSGQANLLPQLWDQIQRESQWPPFLAVAGRWPPRTTATASLEGKEKGTRCPVLVLRVHPWGIALGLGREVEGNFQGVLE